VAAADEGSSCSSNGGSKGSQQQQQQGCCGGGSCGESHYNAPAGDATVAAVTAHGDGQQQQQQQAQQPKQELPQQQPLQGVQHLQHLPKAAGSSSGNGSTSGKRSGWSALLWLLLVVVMAGCSVAGLWVLVLLAAQTASQRGVFVGQPHVMNPDGPLPECTLKWS
jgi:hypothetical protein